MTIEQFLCDRYDLPDAGQWAELERGDVQVLQPPDVDHGNTILNLSKAISEWTTVESPAYPCFDLGLVLQRTPATLRFPAVSFFTGERFVESDKEVTEVVPVAIVEMASTADRRARMDQRVSEYRRWGVQTVWIIDPAHKRIQVIEGSEPTRDLFEPDRLAGSGYLRGFECPVATLFREPDWWKRPAARPGKE